jgi:hypothetical protein
VKPSAIVAAEMAENRRSLGGGQVSQVLAAGDRGCHLNGGDAGDIKGMSGLSIDEGFDPGCAGLLYVAFDKPTGIEEVIRHFTGARG